MSDGLFKPLVFGALNIAMFGALYIYGRRWHPQLALVVTSLSCIIMILLCYRNSTFLGLSFLLCIICAVILRKPDQKAAFQELYTRYGIVNSTRNIPTVLTILGDKKWMMAEGSFPAFGARTKPIPYYFWQGNTKHFVSGGRYGGSTTFTFFLAFIFPPGAVSPAFREKIAAAADKSGYSRGKRFKNFFSADTETPERVMETGDGYLVIEYRTKREPSYYARRFEWLIANSIDSNISIQDTSKVLRAVPYNPN